MVTQQGVDQVLLVKRPIRASFQILMVRFNATANDIGEVGIASAAAKWAP